jgi:7-cyano-7-deazaguanine synthase in queuosine biosynthesis
MMPALKESAPSLPSLRVEVADAGVRTSRSALPCVIGKNLNFSVESLESYFFAAWEPVVYDTLIVAGAVEYCDRTQKRSAFAWGREIELSIPVHDPDRWNHKDVSDALHQALDFLTGDRWRIAFRARKRPVTAVRQGQFPLSGEVSAVIPFSDGLDSRAVAGLMERSLGDKLIRINVGHAVSQRRQRFTAVPYKVLHGKRPFVESSVRSRGFKFALIAGVAAYFANADQIIVPESGQGALGPALLAVGQAYPDYSSHPRFTNRMERFLAALLGRRVSFQFPQLWNTKGETLARFIKECPDSAFWADTWSCWQQSRQASVDGKKRQCGICAACMLRRLSVHAAGLTEPKATYVWEDLRARAFAAGAAAAFDRRRVTRAMNEYAIAGALHLDHLAALAHSAAAPHVLSLNATHLSQACKLDARDVRARLDRLLTQHETEWNAFVRSLGPKSFVARWAPQAR